MKFNRVWSDTDLIPVQYSYLNENYFYIKRFSLKLM